MKSLRKWMGLFFLLLPVYKYVKDWREEDRAKELRER